MENQEIEHFVHAPGGKPRVAVAAAEDTMRDALIRLGVIRNGSDEVYIFVGECVEALDEADEIDNGADAHGPVDISLTVAVLDIHRHRHVHVHHCRHIGVEVNFDGKTKRHRFAPNTAVGVATDWACRKFHLDPAAAGEYVLQLCHTTDQPRSDEHLGDVVQGETCSICFDLVKELTPKG